MKALPAEERSRLALHLGVEGASELVEDLAERREGLPTEELLSLLRDIKDGDTGRLKSFVSGLRDSRTWSTLLGRGLEATSARTAAPLPEATESTTPRPGPTPEVAVVPPPSLPPRDAPPASPPSSATQPTCSVVAGERPSSLPAFPHRRPAIPPVLRPALPRPRSELGAPGAAARLTARLAATRSLVRRFRALREGLALGVYASPAELQKVLVTFPEGWPRRRALQALLRAGLDARSLIAGLRPVDQRWFKRA